MTEQIGKIILDYKYYPGEDFYCDGEIEDELLTITKNYAQIEFRKIIEERADWPVLYHLSSLRENIVDWIPMEENAKVLEVGSGCGAITGKLAEKAETVTCIDLSKKRSLINAYRHQDCDNITIHVGNFKDIEEELPCDYDYICLIGVFEYGQSYMGTEHPYEDFLNIMLKHLKQDGRLIIAIENKLGLKYFAGCKEDHLGTYFSGIEDYAQGGGVRTFSRTRLEEIMKTCGQSQYSFYYPYPDYKFMTTIYSDQRLPQQGELSDNRRNFDRDRMLLFNEKQAYDGIIADKLFPVFSNSYLVVVGKELDVKYAKYSNDRATEYEIRTEIIQKENGDRVVKKHALSKEAADHILNMETAYQNLTKRYEGGKLKINECSLDEDGTTAEFEYVYGMTLEEKLDQCLERDDIEGFHALFKEYMERISYHEEMSVADYDLIFSNIIISPKEQAEDEAEDGTNIETKIEANTDIWTVIDYEWTFGKPMTAKETAFRAIYCYILEDEKRNKLNLDLILEALELTEKEAQEYRIREMDFQKFVTGKYKSMAEMREAIGYKLMEPQKWIHKFDDSTQKERIQIYEDKGNGYIEDESYFVKDAYESENIIKLELELDGNVSMLRIDPAMDYCAVKIKELWFNAEPVSIDKRNIVTNGRTMKDGSYVFATDDPNINVKINNLNRLAQNTLEAELEIIRLPEAIASDMAGAVKKLF